MRNWILSAAFLLTLVGSMTFAEDRVASFLQTHCHRCHGSEVQKSDRRFDTLPDEINSIDGLQSYQDIVDQLNLGSMPPAEEPQPSDDERTSVVAQLSQRIATAQVELKAISGHSVLRRLNSWEYRQTIGDLLGINTEVWDPAENFPAEVKVDGFDNNGQGLVTSGILMDHYLSAAEEAIQRATQFEDRPAVRNYIQRSPFYFEAKQIPNLPKLFQVDRFRFVPETPYTDLYGRHYRGGHIGFLPLAQQGGVPSSGIYTIRVRAAAVGRVHPYEKALDDFRNGDPLVMEVAGVDRRGSVESTGNVSKMTSLARIELTNEEPQWFEWRMFMEQGFEPEIRFLNGPISAKRLVRLLTTQAADQPEIKPFVGLKNGNEKSHGVLQAYQGPRLRIWEMQLEGPYVDIWPSTGHSAIYGELRPDELDSVTIAARLEAFAKKAFRRLPREGELEPVQRLVTGKLQEGMQPLPALQLGCQAILCSPGFLYLNLGQGDLDDVALASRLSYFLWSSPPDERLLELAAANQLRSQRAAEVERMLADPKSNRFIRHFVRRWLDLDNIGEMPPSEDFLAYYRDNLETAMRGETEAFFQHILDHNLPPGEFLSADYSFLNRELALHYGVPGVEGNSLQLVSLRGSVRGGLLGQGAFLTASANGVDTSPVVRGIYVLEKILGDRPPPPPPDVPAIEPDIRGATTIREQLEKHRNVPTCAECHRKIDPLGFALEQFDAIGGWRDKYTGKIPIDATGQLPDGSSFASIEEFRSLLQARGDQLNRCLTEKLMTYALGRELDPVDRHAIDRMLTELDSQQGGLRDLVRMVVESETFSRN